MIRLLAAVLIGSNMKALTATLAAEQQKDHIRPIVSAALKSNRWPRFQVHATGTAGQGTNSDAASNGSVIVRAYIQPGGSPTTGTLYIQTITDPENISQWYSWQPFDAGSINTNFNLLAVLWTGTRFVVVYRRDFPTAFPVLHFFHSTDGLTWTGPVISVSISGSLDPATTANIHTVSTATANRAALVIGFNISTGLGNTFVAYRWNESTLNFSLLMNGDATSQVYTIESIAAIYRTTQDDYPTIFSMLQDPSSPTARPIRTIRGDPAFPSTPWQFAEMATYLNAAQTVFTALLLQVCTSQQAIDGYHWLTFFRQFDTGQVRAYIARSVDGLLWSAPRPLHFPTDATASRLRIFQHGSYIYLHTHREVWRAPTAPADVALSVIDYKHQDDRLDITLDDPTGSLAASSLLAEDETLSIARGAQTKIGSETIGLHNYTITSLQTSSGRVLLKAETAIARMARWRADTLYRWSGTLAQILERLAAMCDIHTVTVDSNGAWATTITDFIVQPNTNGLHALATLQDLHPFMVEMNDDALQASVPTSSPNSTYDFLNHNGIRSSALGVQPTTQTVIVFGDGVIAHAVDPSSRHKPRSITLTNLRYTTQAQAQTRADIELLLQQEQRRTGSLKTLPHFGIQRGDVIALSNELLRVIECSEQYRRGDDFFQTLTLRGTT
jgi:hypothetical protein